MAVMGKTCQDVLLVTSLNYGWSRPRMVATSSGSACRYRCKDPRDAQLPAAWITCRGWPARAAAVATLRRGLWLRRRGTPVLADSALNRPFATRRVSGWRALPPLRSLPLLPRSPRLLTSPH